MVESNIQTTYKNPPIIILFATGTISPVPNLNPLGDRDCVVSAGVVVHQTLSLI